MTNAAAVTQGPAASGEAIADGPRSAGRKGGAEGDGGGFPTLLSQLAGGKRDRTGGETPRASEGASETRPADADRRRIAGWFSSTAGAFGEEAPAETGEGLLLDRPVGLDGADGALTERDAGSLALVLADAGGVAGQLVAGGGAVAMVNDAAAVAPRAATSDSADAAAPQPGQSEGDTEPLSAQELLQLAALPRRSSRWMEDDARPTVAEVVVLRRETHLAPVRTAAVVDAATELAAQMSSGGTGALPAGAQRATDSVDAAAPRAGSVLDGDTAAQPLVPHLAVSEARGADRGGATLQGTTVMDRGLQEGAQAALPGGDVMTGVEAAAPVVRADAPADAGQATGLLQQLADRIASEAGSTSAAPRADAPALGQRPPPFASAVKVLRIELQPADLGTVTVRMSLRDQALQLDLEVGRGETAHLIQRDREALSTLLRSAGYLVDGLDVRVVDQSGPGASAASSQPSMQMPAGGQSGSSGADARSPGARPQDERAGGNAFGNQRNREDEQTGHAPRRGIYV